MSGAQQGTIVDAEQPQALAVQAAPDSGLVAMLERLATNKDVDVEKMERIIAMQERILDRNAEAAFNMDFAEMQAEIPTIVERGKTDKAKYALLEDIVEAVRPVLQRHGFSLSFRTEWPDKKTVKVVGILTHKQGHSRQSEFLSEADTSGSKNAIQALGSAVSYGHRYTTRDLLNITSRGEDDDATRAGRPSKKVDPTPDGFQTWWDDLEVVAEDGLPALEAAWKKSKPAFRTYLIANSKDAWESLKRRAGTVRA